MEQWKHEWIWPILPETTYDSDGDIESILVVLRTGDPVGHVQPDPKKLVLYELGHDGFPVAIRYFEPIGDFWCPADQTGWKKKP